MMLRDRLEAIEADISTLKIDAIVNAANAPLIMGGGVDGAIRRKAGREIEDDLRRIGRCPTGKAVITRGYRLPAKFVIHTVAPMWGSGGVTADEKEKLLAACYHNALALAHDNDISSIAFPCLGTGAYAWPTHRAVKIAFETVVEFLGAHETPARAIFCCYNDADQLQRYATLIDDLNS